MWFSVFWSSRSNILGLTAAKRKVKERPREKVTGGGIQSQEQMEIVFTHTPPSPWHYMDNCASPPPLLPSPLPNGSYPIGALRDLSVELLWWPQLGGYEYMNWYWTVMVNAFLLLPLFDRMPVSRDIDCYSLAKFSEILAGADILSMPIFVTFSAWQAVTVRERVCP